MLNLTGMINTDLLLLDIVSNCKESSLKYNSWKKTLEANDIPKQFCVTRYHSLSVSRNKFPKELQITAEAKCGEIMALKHKILPIYGVQFHPESILTKFGHKILENFVKVLRDLNG